MRKGADVYIRDSMGDTPLSLATGSLLELMRGKDVLGFVNATCMCSLNQPFSQTSTQSYARARPDSIFNKTVYKSLSISATNYSGSLPCEEIKVTETCRTDELMSKPQNFAEYMN